MKIIFEQRLKDFIQKQFALQGAQWETILSEDTTELWKTIDPKVNQGRSIYYTIQGKHDIYFVLEDSIFEIAGSTDNSEVTGSTSIPSKTGSACIPSKSSYNLVLCANKPQVNDHEIKYTLRLALLNWSHGYLFQDTNGISELEIKLITPVFRPFERYTYLMDFMTRVVTIPFHDD